jgi:hypothetical protein
MSLRMNNGSDSRLRRAQRRASDQARRVGPTAGQARRVASSRIYDARVWGAPRLDRAGHFVEHRFGPRVGSMLHRTAGRVKPARNGPRRSLAMMLLAIGGALGAVGAIATRRGRSRSSEETRRPAPAERLSAVSENPPGHANTTH